MPTPFQRVCILIAMRQEAMPLIEHFNFQALPDAFDAALPMEAYRATIKGMELTIVLNGRDRQLHIDCVATQPATLAAYLAVQHFKPQLIVNAGTAGGFMEHGTLIGDVYVSHRAVKYHDRRIPLPGFDRYGFGNYPCAKVEGLAAVLGLKLGSISTGNSLDITPTDLAVINTETPVVKEMEAAAIAWVADMYGIPFIALKSITDLIDNDQAVEEEFIQNLAIAANNLKMKMIMLIEHLSNLSIEEIS